MVHRPSVCGPDERSEPVTIRPKSDQRPYVRQYRLKPEAEAGITPIVESLLSSGVIRECNDSPVNTQRNIILAVCLFLLFTVGNTETGP